MSSATRLKQWSNLFANTKYKTLGNEVAEGVNSKYTNFSLTHIMDKFNFLPTLFLNREFLLYTSYKNPFLLRNVFLPQNDSYILLDKDVKASDEETKLVKS